MQSSRSTQSRASQRRALPAIAVCALALLCLALPAAASAAAPDFLLRIFNDQVDAGSGPGELKLPSAVVADPSNGHLFVVDSGNNRLSEYTAWGLFVRAWGWGVRDGSPALQVCEPSQPTDTPPAGLCRAGLEGGGAGQLFRPEGLARDPAGDLYVFDRVNRRVQKFSPAGEFILMFGGAVNKTKVEEGSPAAQQNRCPVDPTDACQAGAAGSASGYFASNLFEDTMEYSAATNAILVGDSNRIQEFNLDGTFKGEIPFSGELTAFAGRTVEGLDVDSSGNAYLSINGLPDIYKLSPAGVPLDPGKPGESKFTVSDPKVLAVDHNGNVFIVNGSTVLEYDAAAQKLLPTPEEEEASISFPDLAETPQLLALATNICEGGEEPGSLYVAIRFPSANQSYIDNYGPPPIACEPPPSRPPRIATQYADLVRDDSARLRAQIDPRLWADTTYFVQYGVGKCSEGGCDNEQPLAPGAQLTDEIVSGVQPPVAVLLQGLQPGTTYHYRFVAKSGGGGPVYGEGGGDQLEPGVFRKVGEEDTFRTQVPPGESAPCPANEAFRTGASAALPDCRAYELVSPLDKENGDAAFLPPAKVFFEFSQSAVSGERFTYSSLTPFAEPQGAPFVSQFLASRDPLAGWSDQDISPPRTAGLLAILRALPNEFKVFSPDLCSAWLLHNSTATLTEDAVPGYPNLYRRDNCAEPAGYEALSTAKPPVRPPSLYSGLGVMGFSEDETVTAFLSEDALTSEAPVLNEGLPEGTFAKLLLYVHGPEGLRFVCFLPSGAPIGTACGAGRSAVGADAHGSNVQGALSVDASRLYWTAYNTNLLSPGSGLGQIYLTTNPDQPQSAHLHGSGAGSGDLTGPAGCTGDTQKFSKTISNLKCSAAFVIGQPISGPGIPASTVVTELPEAGKLRIDKEATLTAVGSTLAGPASATVANLTTSFGAFGPEQQISGPGIPTGTTIESCAPACGPGATSLTLSALPTKTTTGAYLDATSQCTEADAACTIPVSEPLAGQADAEYWGAAANGSRAFFRIAAGPLKDNVYEFDAAAGASQLIATGGLAPMGISEDASRLYFASSKVLGEGGSEGAEEGANNLYLYEAPAGGGAGSFKFIIGLSGSDLFGSEVRPGPVSPEPTRRSSTVSRDGLHAAFGSSASPTPTGYDNLDAHGGEPDQEVYLYDAAAQKLVCASCNPTGVRPAGQNVGTGSQPLWLAARLNTRRMPLQAPRQLSDDGARLFFESHEALVPRDTNATWDVYQWEAAGKGSCTPTSTTYNPDTGGCVELLSSGLSPSGARFLDADPSGTNVFIGTQAGLIKADPGLNDVYDVRINGGFPEAPPPAPGCEGEACQSPPPAPEAQTPASEAFHGAGNVHEEPSTAKCPKGKVKKHGRCVKKHATHRRHNHQRPQR